MSCKKISVLTAIVLTATMPLSAVDTAMLVPHIVVGQASFFTNPQSFPASASQIEQLRGFFRQFLEYRLQVELGIALIFFPDERFNPLGNSLAGILDKLPEVTLDNLAQSMAKNPFARRRYPISLLISVFINQKILPFVNKYFSKTIPNRKSFLFNGKEERSPWFQTNIMEWAI